MIDLNLLQASSHLPEEELRSVILLFEANTLPSWIFDATTLRFLSVNDAAVVQYGYSREEFLSMSLQDIRPEEEVTNLLAFSQNLPASAKNAGIWRHRRKDGSVFDVEILRYPLIYRGRSAFLAVAIDVSARTLAQIIQSSEDAIISITLEGTINYWNSAAEHLFQYSPQEALGKNISMLTPHDRQEEHVQMLRRLRGGERLHNVEAVRTRKDGLAIDVCLNVSPIRNAAGDIVGLWAVIRDNREQKKAAGTLQEATREVKLLSDLIKQASQAAVVATPEGKLLRFNRAYEKLTGYSAEDLISKTSSELTPAQWHEIERSHIAELFKTGKAVRYEKEYKRKDGRIVPVELMVDQYRDENEALYLFAFVTDITERKKTERQVARLLLREQRAREDAEQARSRAQFLAEVSATIAAAMDYNVALQALAQLVTRQLADLCIVWSLQEDQTIKALAVAHRDPAITRRAEEVVRNYPPLQTTGEGIARVISTATSIVHSEVTDDILQRVAHSEAHLRELRSANFQSWMGVPLMARGRILGGVSFFSTNPHRRYSNADVRFAEELAAHASIAIDNARLFGTLSQSLEEKDVLLRELHHRVKNNLQVISSLLSLQLSRVEDKGIRAALEESRNRIRTMALIHEKLYATSADLARVDFAEYLQTLAQYLFTTFGINDSQRIRFKVEGEKFPVRIEDAVPLGLIANELISNSLKYAFPGTRAGVVAITLKYSDKETNVMTIADDGIGLPAHVDVSTAGTLGLRLVLLLTRQLDGSMEVVSENPGTCIRITFPQH